MKCNAISVTYIYIYIYIYKQALSVYEALKTICNTNMALTRGVYTKKLTGSDGVTKGQTPKAPMIPYNTWKWQSHFPSKNHKLNLTLTF